MNKFDVSNKDSVVINMPVRTRDWVLPYSLEAILNLDYDKRKIALRFIINDSTDDSWKILINFKRKYSEAYQLISIYTFNMASIEDNRDNHEVRRKTIYNMRFMKNMFLDYAIGGRQSYWWFVESDLCVKKDTLKILINADKDVIAAWCNTHRKMHEGVYNFLRYNSHLDRFDRNFDHKEIINASEPVHMDLVSGPVLMRSWLCDKVRFRQFYNSGNMTEDEGFIRNLMRLGVERYVHPKAFTYHIMSKEALESYKKETGLNGLDLFNKEEVKKEG